MFLSLQEQLEIAAISLVLTILAVILATVLTVILRTILSAVLAVSAILIVVL